MFNWHELLDPSNGGPGQPPGYAQAVQALYNKPPKPKKKKKGKKK